MKKIVVIAALACLAACGKKEAPAEQAAAETAAPAEETTAPAPEAVHAGPPPLPLYSMREEAPPGDRLAEGRDGKALYEYHCGACHLANGMGANLLTKQRMMLGEPPQMGLLVNRDDLTAPYVETVVRNGKMAMPPLSRVEVTDAELASIAAYLAKEGAQ